MLISQTVLRVHCIHHKLSNCHACPVAILNSCWRGHSSSTTIYLLWKQCIFTGCVPKVRSQKYLQLVRKKKEKKKKTLNKKFPNCPKHTILAVWLFVLLPSKSMRFTSAYCWKRYTAWRIDIITAEAEDHHYHCSRGPLQRGQNDINQMRNDYSLIRVTHKFCITCFHSWQCFINWMITVYWFSAPAPLRHQDMPPYAAYKLPAETH